MSERGRIALAEAIGTHDPRRRWSGHRDARDRWVLPDRTRSACSVSRSRSGSACCARRTRSARSPGCHINPAVTVGLWAIGKTKSGDVPFYIGRPGRRRHRRRRDHLRDREQPRRLQRQGERVRVERLRRALAGRIQARRAVILDRDRVHRAVRVRHREHEPQVDVARLHRHHRRAHADADPPHHDPGRQHVGEPGAQPRHRGLPARLGAGAAVGRSSCSRSSAGCSAASSGRRSSRPTTRSAAALALPMSRSRPSASSRSS